MSLRKFNGGGMNMENYKDNYKFIKYTDMMINQQDENTLLLRKLNQLDHKKMRYSNDKLAFEIGAGKTGERIHSKQASFNYWQKQNGINFDNPMTYQFQPSKELTKPFFQTTCSTMSANLRKLPKRTITNQDEKQILLPQEELRISTSKVDPKLKRLLSQQTKRNFMQFLLVQKAGQANENKILDYFKREYNFQLPMDEQGYDHPIQNKNRKKQLKRKIIYLQQQNENEDQIKTQVNLIMHSPQNHKQIQQQDDLPLDEYIRRSHEATMKMKAKRYNSLSNLKQPSQIDQFGI